MADCWVVKSYFTTQTTAFERENMRGNQERLCILDAIPVMLRMTCSARPLHLRSTSVIVSLLQTLFLLSVVKECHSSVILEESTDIVYLYRSAEASPLTYAKLVLKGNILRKYFQLVSAQLHESHNNLKPVRLSFTISPP